MPRIGIAPPPVPVPVPLPAGTLNLTDLPRLRPNQPGSPREAPATVVRSSL